jgi:hypothetical protein
MPGGAEEKHENHDNRCVSRELSHPATHGGAEENNEKVTIFGMSADM